MSRLRRFVKSWLKFVTLNSNTFARLYCPFAPTAAPVGREAASLLRPDRSRRVWFSLLWPIPTWPATTLISFRRISRRLSSSPFRGEIISQCIPMNSIFLPRTAIVICQSSFFTISKEQLAWAFITGNRTGQQHRSVSILAARLCRLPVWESP